MYPEFLSGEGAAVCVGGRARDRDVMSLLRCRTTSWHISPIFKGKARFESE